MVGRLNILKSVSSSLALTNLIYTCNTVPCYTMEIDKLILKVISEKLKIQNSENFIELEKRGLILPPIQDSP